jgi:hypothetical protein
VDQAEQDPHNTVAGAAEAQLRQARVDRVLLAGSVVTEEKMLFKQVQINFTLAEAAEELGKWLREKAAMAEAETAQFKITKGQLLLQQDLAVEAAEMAANTEQVDLVQAEL